LTQDEQFSNPFDKVARGDGGKTHCEIVERPTPEASMKFICGKAQKLEGYRTHIYMHSHPFTSCPRVGRTKCKGLSPWTLDETHPKMIRKHMAFHASECTCPARA
jgi:hypothetical protein